MAEERYPRRPPDGYRSHADGNPQSGVRHARRRLKRFLLRGCESDVRGSAQAAIVVSADQEEEDDALRERTTMTEESR